jgi:AAA domain
MMEVKIPEAELDAAVEHLSWVAEHQSAGFLKLMVLRTSSDGRDTVGDQKWFNNRDPVLAAKAKRYLQRWSGKLVTVLYSVSSFADQKATAENANPSKLVHVDYDKPSLPEGILAPTRVVKSSVRGMHLFWGLQRELPPTQIQIINKSLTYAHGGDKGGHSSAKQLRLVGFPNLKYDPPHLVKVMSDSRLIYEPAALVAQREGKLSTARSPNLVGSDVVQEAEQLNAFEVTAKYRSRFDVFTRLRLSQKVVMSGFTIRVDGRSYNYGGDDRSEIIWGIADAMRRAGAAPSEVLAVVMQTIFWRSRLRDGKDENALRLISRVFESEARDHTVSGIVEQNTLVAVDPSVWAGLPVPVRKWLVKDWIPKRKVTLFYGDGATGKTLLAMMLIVACATDKPFLGFQVQGLRAFALLAENDEDDTRITLEAVCKHYDASLGDLKGRVRIASRAGFDNILMAFDEGTGKHTQLFEELLRQVTSFKADLILIETAADLFGGNENARGEVRKFIAECCGKIAVETNAAVIVSAHPSVAGLKSGEGSSGSTAWNNSARSRLFLQRDIDDKGHEANPDLRILSRKKANFAKAGESITLMWRDGVFVVDDPVKGRHGTTENEKKLVAEVGSAFTARNPWSAHHQAGARHIIPWMRKELKMRDATAKELLDRLMRSGEIVEIEYDRHTHRRGLATADQAAKQQLNKEAN